MQKIISVLATTAVLPTSFADFNSMVDMFSKLAENYTYNFDNDFAGMRSAQAPELQGTVPGSQGLVFLKNLWNYGCWCRFEEMHGTGTGAPVNAMDEVCRTLHHGYTCMQHDDGECNPFGQTYRSVVHSAESKETMVIDCAAKNPNNDECNHRACAIESWFVLEILRLYFKEKYAFDPAYMATTGWDGSECPGSAATTTNPPPMNNGNNGIGNGNGQQIEDADVDINDKGDVVPFSGYERQCCGDYPTRFPFNGLNGARDCCGGVTYNPFMMTCCDSTVIVGNTC